MDITAKIGEIEASQEAIASQVDGIEDDMSYIAEICKQNEADGERICSCTKD